MWHKENPDVIGSYLVFTDDCFVCMAFFNSDYKWCEMWSQQFLNVKYWMPLPEAPTADNVEGANLHLTTATVCQKRI
jgi:hypothetical protein